MKVFIPFNRIKKILSVVLLIFLVLPLAKCEMFGSTTKKIPQDLSRPNSSLSPMQAEAKSESKNYFPSIVIVSLAGTIDNLNFLKEWGYFFSTISSLLTIFLPLALWRVSETKSAIILLCASPLIAYAQWILIWSWPIQLVAGYLLTLIWILLFALCIVQICEYCREKRRAL